jgi:ABC-2 type transport system permease protein
MRKFLAVVKREYLQRVRTKLFIVATIMAPVVMSLFGVVPALIFSIKPGGPVHIAVIDQTGKLYPRLQKAVSDREDNAEEAAQFDPNTLNANSSERIQQAARRQGESFELEEIKAADRSLNEVKNELNQRVQQQDIDGYVVIPADLLQNGHAEFLGRNTGDVFTKEHLEDALSQAVRDQRLADANIDAGIVRELSEPIDLQAVKVGTAGEEKDSGEGFFLVFGIGFIIYLTILMYGQVVLGAVVEEKETRIAEILFSSVRPFPLMMGKLIGVSLVALTQLTIWATAFLAFTLFGVGVLASKGVALNIPHVPPIVFLYFGLFFLLGYFIYATMYALVGSMVTTTQEGGQLAMPIILLLVVGFYLAFPVIKSPDSSFAFWVSLFPFFSPITMLVRIVTQTPPFWQILLALLLGYATVLLLIWLAARIYRVGMLMYGKKASLPEVWRWVRQS